MKLYRSNYRDRANICSYPNMHNVIDAESLKEAVSKDYVCATYTDNYRSNTNFIKSDCLPVDVDNDSPQKDNDSPQKDNDSPQKDNDTAPGARYITPEDVAAAFPGVKFFVHYSRNNMKEKNGRVAPRFHVLFPIDEVSSKEEYEALKERVASVFPYADSNALDAARFFFGTENPVTQYYDGPLNLTQWLGAGVNCYGAESYGAGAESYGAGEGFNGSGVGAGVGTGVWAEGSEGESLGIIPKGSRNKTIYSFAINKLTLCGEERAEELYLKRVEDCVPKLSDYEVNATWKSALKFYRERIKTRKDYISPEEFAKRRSGAGAQGAGKSVGARGAGEGFGAGESVGARGAGDIIGAEAGAEVLIPKTFTDDDEAKLILEHYGENIHFNEGMGYMTYNGTLWVPGNLAVERVVEEFTNRQYECYLSAKENARGEEDECGGKELEKFRKLVMRYKNASGVHALLDSIKRNCEVSSEAFDSDPFLLNTPRYAVDLRTGEAREHRASDMATLMTKVDPATPSVTPSTIWSKALNTFFCNDKDLINFVQEVMGLASIGMVFQEALIIAYGEGRNGKSTFFNSINEVLGSYGGNISTEVLMANNPNKNIKPEIAEMRGKRLLIAAELDENARLSTASLKKICSTDKLRGEKKFMQPFDFTPTHLTVLHTNHLPSVSSQDSGTWRRLKVIPFNAVIEGKSDIKNYTSYLVKNAGGAILSWIIEGAKRVIANDYQIETPEAVKKASGEYKTDNDWCKRFLDDRCELSEGLRIGAQVYFSAYRSWTKENGESARKRSDFTRDLERYGITKKRTEKGWFYFGVDLRKADI